LAVTALYKAFASTKAGGEQVEQMMAGLSAIIDVVRDRVLKVGQAIAKFFSGDFKGALKDARSSVSGIGGEIEKEFKQAAQAKKYLQEVDDAIRGLSVSRAKLNRDLAKSKEIITDENASYAEKKKAINEVRIAEEKQTNAELKNAEKKLKAIKLANSLSDTNKENLDKQAAAEAELFALQEKSATDRRAIRKTEERADKEEQARLKTIASERNAKAKEVNDKAKALAKEKYDAEKLLIDELVKNENISFEERRKNVNNDNLLTKADKDKYLKQINDEELKKQAEHSKAIADLNKRYDDEKLNREADTAVKKENLDYERKLTEINNLAQTELEKQTLIEKLDAEHKERLLVATKTDGEKIAAEKKVIEDKITADKLAAEQARANINNIAIESAQGLVAILGGLGEKNKKLQKAALLANTALSIAQIIANTNVGAAKEVATKGVFGLSTSAVLYAKMGISIASVLAATAKGLKGLGGGSAGGGGGAAPSGGGGGSAPTGGGAPAPQFNVVGNSGVNQIAQTLGAQQPVQAYVVASNVTTQQSLDRNIVANASLGYNINKFVYKKQFNK
jgi:hypothetical protein